MLVKQNTKIEVLSASLLVLLLETFEEEDWKALSLLEDVEERKKVVDQMMKKKKEIVMMLKVLFWVWVRLVSVERACGWMKMIVERCKLLEVELEKKLVVVGGSLIELSQRKCRA